MSGEKVVELRPPRSKEDTNNYVGIVVALASWGMMFAALFFIYAAVRAREPSWPPAGIPRIGLLQPTLSTLAIAASSVAADRALAALKRADVARFRKLLGFTLFLGVTFLELQFLLWSRLHGAGVFLAGNIYGSIVLGFTYLHAAHIVVGLVVLAVVFARARKGRYTAHNWFGVRSAVYFWHFVDVVWLAMWLTLFVI